MGGAEDVGGGLSVHLMEFVLEGFGWVNSTLCMGAGSQLMGLSKEYCHSRGESEASAALRTSRRFKYDHREIMSQY